MNVLDANKPPPVRIQVSNVDDLRTKIENEITKRLPTYRYTQLANFDDYIDENNNITYFRQNPV